jgi:hypothetical protein
VLRSEDFGIVARPEDRHQSGARRRQPHWQSVAACYLHDESGLIGHAIILAGRDCDNPMPEPPNDERYEDGSDCDLGNERNLHARLLIWIG